MSLCTEQATRLQAIENVVNPPLGDAARLGQFGLLTAISTFYSYVTAIVVMPLALRAWARVFD